MKTWTRALLCVALSFMCVFTCIGYAIVSQNLSVTGSVRAEAPEPEGLYIAHVAVHTTTGLAAQQAGILLPTSLLSTTHGTNERIEVSSFPDALAFFKRYIKTLAPC